MYIGGTQIPAVGYSSHSLLDGQPWSRDPEDAACADAGEHRGCCGAHPELLPPFTPAPRPPFFPLKILDSQMLTGCSWEMCTCPSPLWSSSEDCGLRMVIGGHLLEFFPWTPREAAGKRRVQALRQSCLFTRTALTCINKFAEKFF